MYRVTTSQMGEWCEYSIRAKRKRAALEDVRFQFIRRLREQADQPGLS